MAFGTLFYLLILLIAAFIGGSMLKYFKQPPVVGYLLASLILGLVFGSSIQGPTIDFLAQLGIVLLLFTLGLEFPIDNFKKSGRLTVIASIIQVLTTIIILSVVLSQFKIDFYTALFAACAFAMSSTAIIMKILTDKGDMNTHPSQVLISWLITQDLLVVPIMLILPIVGKELFHGNFSFMVILDILKNLFISTFILFILFLLGKKWTPFFINKVALLNNRELLLVAILIITLAFGYLTQLIGFSVEIGAFLMGLMIAKSSQNHAVFSEIRPLRDVFVLLFFVTLGLILPAGFILQNLSTIILVTLLVILVKFVLCLLLLFYLGFHARTSFFVSFGLINVGEFAFVLARMGLKSSLITSYAFGLIVSVALLSILFFPLVFLSSTKIYFFIKRFTQKRFYRLYVKIFSGIDHKLILKELPLSNHVVLCGFGRVGRYIGRALDMAHVPYIVIEYNHQKVNELKSKGVNVIYGDPADLDILDYAQVDYAKAVVIAIPDLHTQTQIITHSLNLNPKISIYCRSHIEGNQRLLKALGASSIVQPEFEASLSISDKILKLFGESQEDISGKISRLKIEHGLE